jgi:predicted DNA-binding transcriptional regulator YafY
MARIVGAMSTSSRLLRLLSLLQTPRDWTGTELADRLEVSPRTIRNDIERLRDLGYPVHATRGSVGGYRLEAGTSMPPLLLEDDEAVAVAIGLRTATSGAVTGIGETSLRALAKLEQVLPPRLRRQVAQLQGVTVQVRRRPGPTVDPAMLSELARLAREHWTVRFDYSDRRQEASRRRAEPYRIVNAGQRWYLVAWDLDRADWRTFRVDRIREGMSSGPRFTPRALTDDEAEALVARGVPPEARRHQARVLVQMPAAQLAERIGPWIGTVEPLDDESCVLVTGAERLEDLAAYLGLLGTDFRVTEPPELVEQLRVLARRYAAAAS